MIVKDIIGEDVWSFKAQYYFVWVHILIFVCFWL